MHLLGYRATNGRGRTTSLLRAFDRATGVVTTSSGNRYLLTGVPSADGLDDPLVPRWLAMAGLSHRDVEIVGSDDP